MTSTDQIRHGMGLTVLAFVVDHAPSAQEGGLQGRSDRGYIGIYPPPPKKKKSVYLKNFMWLFFSCDPGQIRYMFTCGTYVLKLQL